MGTVLRVVPSGLAPKLATEKVFAAWAAVVRKTRAQAARRDRTSHPSDDETVARMGHPGEFGEVGFVEILHLEAVSVLGDERFVVVWRERGPCVERGVVDVNFDVILAGLEELRDVEAIGWVPERACRLAVDEDEGGFADGRIKVGVHARAGARYEWVGEAVIAERSVFGWRIGRAGEGGASVNGEIGCRLRKRGEVEIARVDDFAGVVKSGGVGSPVGEGVLI
jgi:hypothetical protein